MGMVPAICTQCGAQINVDNTKETAICEHCGTPFIIENAVSKNSINNSINNKTENFKIHGGILYKYYGNNENVIIPNTVFEIADESFKNTYIKSITFDDNLKKIGKEAFYNCRRLEHIDFSGSKIVEVGDSAFEACFKLESFDFTSIRHIGEDAFFGSGLKEVIFPNHPVSVSSGCFSSCYNLYYAYIYHITKESYKNVLKKGRGIFNYDAKLLDIRNVYIDKIVNEYKENPYSYLDEVGEFYCVNFLGNCGFTTFFAQGNTWIKNKNSKCLYCYSDIVKVNDRLFKSHLECIKCKKTIPSYDEYMMWTKTPWKEGELEKYYSNAFEKRPDSK